MALTEHQTLEQLLLDRVEGKYRLVLSAIRWAEEIAKREELKGKPFSIAVETALTELLTGKVKTAEVEKLPPLHREHPKEASESKAAASANHSEKPKKEKK